MAIAFAKAVRTTVVAERPRWRLLGVARRMGTCVDYQLPPVRRFRTTVMFFEEYLDRRSLVPSLRPLVTVAFAGKDHVAALAWSEAPARRFRDADELCAAVVRALPIVERLAAKSVQSQTRATASLARLFDHLKSHFARWYRHAGHALPPASFDEADVAEPAFKAFERWLAREHLLVPAARPTLWHWWRSGDPTSREAYARPPRVNATVRAIARDRTA